MYTVILFFSSSEMLTDNGFFPRADLCHSGCIVHSRCATVQPDRGAETPKIHAAFHGFRKEARRVERFSHETSRVYLVAELVTQQTVLRVAAALRPAPFAASARQAHEL